MRFDAIICSITLHSTHVKEMGLSLARSLLSPFLKIGLTFALVQSDGTSPVASDLSNMSWIKGAISDLSSFSTIGQISSGPAALSGRKFESSLVMPFRFIQMSGIWG